MLPRTLLRSTKKNHSVVSASAVRLHRAFSTKAQSIDDVDNNDRLGQLTTPEIRANYLADSFVFLDSLKGRLESTDQTENPLAKGIIKSAREHIKHPLKPSMETLLNKFPLTEREGMALMCLAESLIRVPDQATRAELLKDQLARGSWLSKSALSNALWLNSAIYGLEVTKNVMPFTAPEIESRAKSIFAKLGSAGIDQAVKEVIRIMAYQFVMGETLNDAWKKASLKNTYSFDMLGEAALTDADAADYYRRYWEAVDFLATKRDVPLPSTLSIKLSALHPRFELHHIDEVKKELFPKVLELVKHAAKQNVPVTIDAEEADRLELSLDLIKSIYQHLTPSERPLLGLAVQAYQKRAPYVLDFLADIVKSSGNGQPMPVRLVKGAYWDQEVKWSQQHGLSDYPVHTDKKHTDIAYLACARKMLDAPATFFPQFASHNPHTIASIVQFSQKEFHRFEFQRLFGMGEGMYNGLKKFHPEAVCRVYAPVGQFDQLLPYLVRRMIENGANTSFVNALGSPNFDEKSVLSDPWQSVLPHVNAGASSKEARESLSPIPRPPELYGELRMNSKAINAGSSQELSKAITDIRSFHGKLYNAAPVVYGMTEKVPDSAYRTIKNPAVTMHEVGIAIDADQAMAKAAIDVAQSYYPLWQRTHVQKRASALKAAATALEGRQSEFMYLLIHEAGKTFNNAQDEIREAVDFLRYYANQAEKLCQPVDCPSVAGEKNTLIRQGLGLYVCVAPWNFPLAIFTGQIAAALAAGNTVIAKSAPETPLVGERMVRLMHDCGVPVQALSFVPGSPELYDEVVWSDPRVRGVAFTGSTRAALHINRQLALRDASAPIAKIVAETGGQNAMIIDSSALVDQAVSDVADSAFDSAGQRCSAARVAYVQKDVYELFKSKLIGRMETLICDNPALLHTDVGPVISQRAKDNLTQHIERLRDAGKKIHQAQVPAAVDARGLYVPPTLIEIQHISEIGAEQFGPILHLISYEKSQLNRVIDEINSTGYGLTFGIHTRVDGRVEHLIERMDVGNIYVNRNIVGAVVESQPFGGRGLSGTGPKAGSPDYLYAFLPGSKTISDNVAAKGGNPALFASKKTATTKKD